MLTTGNSASPEVGSKYCDAQVAAGAEDYYLGRDESPVQWRGSGASAHDLTLGARVERKQSWRWCAANAPAALNGKAGPGEVLKKRALAQEGKQCRSLTRMRNSGSGPVWSSQSFAHACGGERSLRGGVARWSGWSAEQGAEADAGNAIAADHARQRRFSTGSCDRQRAVDSGARSSSISGADLPSAWTAAPAGLLAESLQAAPPSECAQLATGDWRDPMHWGQL